MSHSVTVQTSQEVRDRLDALNDTVKSWTAVDLEQEIDGKPAFASLKSAADTFILSLESVRDESDAERDDTSDSDKVRL